MRMATTAEIWRQSWCLVGEQRDKVGKIYPGIIFNEQALRASCTYYGIYITDT